MMKVLQGGVGDFPPILRPLHERSVDLTFIGWAGHVCAVKLEHKTVGIPSNLSHVPAGLQSGKTSILFDTFKFESFTTSLCAEPLCYRRLQPEQSEQKGEEGADELFKLHRQQLFGKLQQLRCNAL
jgi:hypothetical protein